MAPTIAWTIRSGVPPVPRREILTTESLHFRSTSTDRGTESSPSDGERLNPFEIPWGGPLGGLRGWRHSR
jgi:hypothetical protein